MLNNILISIVAIIVIIQFYLNFSQNKSIIPNTDEKSKNKDNNDTEEESEEEKNNNKNSKNQKMTIQGETIIKEEPSIKDNKKIEAFANGSNFNDFTYGQPHKVTMEVDGPLYEWFFDKPNPWSTIKNKPNKDYSFLYCLKTEVPSIDKFIEWKNIIPNLNFNPNSRELIIPSNDEEGALSVANLILNNFKNKIKTQDIISNNLINVSINKAKNYPVVKLKLKEQIIEMMNSGKLSRGIRKAEYEEDLSKAINNREFAGPNAYNGNEHSFL